DRAGGGPSQLLAHIADPVADERKPLQRVELAAGLIERDPCGLNGIGELGQPPDLTTDPEPEDHPSGDPDHQNDVQEVDQTAGRRRRKREAHWLGRYPAWPGCTRRTHGREPSDASS